MMRKESGLMSMADDYDRMFWKTRREHPVDLAMVACGLEYGEDHVPGEDGIDDLGFLPSYDGEGAYGLLDV